MPILQLFPAYFVGEQAGWKQRRGGARVRPYCSRNEASLLTEARLAVSKSRQINDEMRARRNEVVVLDSDVVAASHDDVDDDDDPSASSSSSDIDEDDIVDDDDIMDDIIDEGIILLYYLV